MVTTVSFLVNTNNQISDVNCMIDSLKCGLNDLQSKTDLLTGIIETSNNSIANQLSAASILLGVVAVVIAIVGGILGFYIRRKTIEVETMVKAVDEKKKTVDELAKMTKELDIQINSNLNELYQKLRKEETSVLLDRLVLEPFDIDNLINQLLARELDDNGFAKLREAYLKLEEQPKIIPVDDKSFLKMEPSSKENYILLFFQNYCYQSIKDDRLRPELVNRFKDKCKKAFKRDIIKTTIDLCKALTDETSTFNKEDVLIAYLKAINDSQFRTLEELRNILDQNITPATLLQNVITQCKEDGVKLALFGMR